MIYRPTRRDFLKYGLGAVGASAADSIGLFGQQTPQNKNQTASDISDLISQIKTRGKSLSFSLNDDQGRDSHVDVYSVMGLNKPLSANVHFTYFEGTNGRGILETTILQLGKIYGALPPTDSAKLTSGHTTYIIDLPKPDGIPDEVYIEAARSSDIRPAKPLKENEYTKNTKVKEAIDKNYLKAITDTEIISQLLLPEYSHIFKISPNKLSPRDNDTIKKLKSLVA